MRIKDKFTPKLSACLAQCMMVDYARQFDGDVYHMWNPMTRKIHVTRDIILKQMLFKKKVDQEAVAPDAGLNVKINSIKEGINDEVNNDDKNKG